MGWNSHVLIYSDWDTCIVVWGHIHSSIRTHRILSTHFLCGKNKKLSDTWYRSTSRRSGLKIWTRPSWKRRHRYIWHTHTIIYVCMYVHAAIYMYTFTFWYICYIFFLYIYVIYIYRYVHINVCVCVCVYVFVYFVCIHEVINNSLLQKAC